ncbi:GAF domain-containing sensor histidine kinase [Frankia tisae]|uniref:GAF domain-containing sensor histidine kinase n=1 Tax=Frankia tisae TaxID=2950104 RepID=UPI0021BF414A|nr:GAF domain-containing sensor histidine kinase [Frankia tisae]
MAGPWLRAGWAGRLAAGLAGIAALAGLAAVAQLAVLASLDAPVDSTGRAILLRSGLAALAVALVAPSVWRRAAALAARLSMDGGRPDDRHLLTTFGARMTRALPMDELLLQLAESLRETVGPAGAEVWVGSGGALSRAISVPERPPATLVLPERERTVAGRTRVVGDAWLKVWAPDVLDAVRAGNAGDAGEAVRVAPIAHLGSVLGLLVVRRGPRDAPFGSGEETVLVDLARQVGLALHNINLDTALQASLRELRASNAELTASRARVVAAADESRRRIERDLHDGAQQHLVALAAKAGLARRFVERDPDRAAALLDDLRGEIRAVGAELRDLAHGIYPPLLRQHGLGEAVRTAVARLPRPCSVEVTTAARYAEQVETAIYFCCLEASHNAVKHAGAAVTLRIEIFDDGAGPGFRVIDDGAGFDPAAAGGERGGTGLVNMADRLGAVGGRLTVESAPGRGTRIHGAVPAALAPGTQGPVTDSPRADR